MNNYQIYEEIGHGRNSVVRKGRRKNTIEYYAIASYDKGQRGRVNTSVQFLRTLSHPNILKFFNWYETGNHLWVITELCTGGNLRTILTEEQKLPENSIRVLAADIARGLSYMHSRGVLYVELKPSNLLLDATGQLRFYDFGLSIVFSHADKAGRVGAPSFMAPERFEEGAVPSMASDLWGFGCVLYEMAAGKPPFDGDSTKELISNIVSKPHEPLSGFSPEFTKLVDGLLTKDPATRATWADVAALQVFANFTSPEQFPKQPHFEAYIKQKAAVEGRTISRETQRREHDVLRASINAERNLNRIKGVRSDLSSVSDQNGYLTAANAGAGSSNSLLGRKGSDVQNNNTAGQQGSSTSAVTTAAVDDTAVDGKVQPVNVARSITKANFDLEMDFRDPSEAVDNEKDASTNNGGDNGGADGGKGANAGMMGTTSPNPANDDGIPSDVPPTASAAPPSAGSGITSPPGTAQHPQTPLDQQPTTSTRAATQVLEVIAIEDIISHPQDAHLRPLVANNRIEKYAEAKVDLVNLQQATGITPVPALQLRELPREKKDAYLTSVYEAISPSNNNLSLSEKTALVAYFETLCADSQVAEMVTNCSLMTLFSQLISPSAGVKASTTVAAGAGGSVAAAAQFRMQVATVMGLLVRHSNFIDDAIHGSTLIPTLVQGFKEEQHPRVRRRILACLGELLFYITSRPPAQRLDWRVDGAAVADAYLSALGDADDVLVHYAAKMIENTCSVADVTGAILFQFTSPAIANALLSRYDGLTPGGSNSNSNNAAAAATTQRSSSQLEHLRVALACAALKLCMADHNLFTTVLQWPSFEPATFLNEIATAGSQRHNAKVVQSYLTILTALFAKTITLNPSTCGQFLKSLNWAKRDTSPSCSVFSAAACPTASNLFAIDVPSTNKIRQTVATMMPRLFKKTFFNHQSSPIRAKACLLLGLLIIADECGITAPPSEMLLQAFAADVIPTGGANTMAAAAANTSYRSIIAQLSRDGGDVVVQKSADAVVAIAQIAAINALNSFAAGKPLIPPPAGNDTISTALYFDLSYYVLSAPMCITVSSAYSQPAQLLPILAKALHRAAANPIVYATHLEALLQLIDTVVTKAMKQAGEAPSNTTAGGGKGAGNNKPIVGDTTNTTTTATITDAHDAKAAAIIAKSKEVAKVITAVILPALVPTLEGTIQRATVQGQAEFAASVAAAGGLTSPTGGTTNGRFTILPPQLQASHPAEMPFVVLRFVNDLLIPIVSDADVCSGDVANNIYVFGREVVKAVPKLLALRDLTSPSTAGIVDGPTSPSHPSMDGGNGALTPSASGVTAGPSCGSMTVTLTLRVLSLLCDTSPSITQELRTTAFVDNLMPVLKLPPQQINNNVLLLLLRLLKSSAAESLPPTSATTTNASVHASSSMSGTNSSRIGAVASAHNTHTTLDLAIMRHCVTKHSLLQWAMQTALKALGDWDSLEDIIISLMELLFLVVYAASQNTASEMAMVCGHLVAGSDTTPLESLLLKVCVQHPSTIAAADCASSCVFLLVGLFEEARKLLVRPRVLTQIREVLNQTCFVQSTEQAERDQHSFAQLSHSQQQAVLANGGGPGGATPTAAIYPHVAAPLLQSLVVLARVAGPAALQYDELLLMQVQQIADTCPHAQLASLCRELVGYLLA